MSTGGENYTEPLTARGQDWPCLRQFSVFMENRVGKLHNLFKVLEKQDLRIVAMSVVDTADFSTVRIVVDHTDRARELFELSQFTFIENDILGVILPDDPQPMLRICMTLMAVEMNIHYAYPLLFRRGGASAIALHVDNVDLATQTLKRAGHTIITENDLKDDDEYFS